MVGIGRRTAGTDGSRVGAVFVRLWRQEAGAAKNGKGKGESTRASEQARAARCEMRMRMGECFRVLIVGGPSKRNDETIQRWRSKTRDDEVVFGVDVVGGACD